MKSIILIASILLSLNVKAADKQKWLGVYTIDSYPVDGCKIVKSSSSVAFQGWFTSLIPKHTRSNKDAGLTDFNNRTSYSKLQNHLVKSISHDFNAVIGFKIQMIGGFAPYETKSDNGDINYAAANYRYYVTGTPVKVVCPN